jgi:predicted TIM-barrel fold metal-dependent hydrolase
VTSTLTTSLKQCRKWRFTVPDHEEEGKSLISKLIDANTFFGTYPKRKVNASPESLTALLKGNNVDKALSLSMKGIFYDYTEGNKETIDICSKYTMLLPVATVDPRKYYGNEDEIEGIANAGFRLIRVFPEHQGWPLDYAPFKMLLKGIERTGLPLMIAANTYGMATKAAELVSAFSFPLILTSIGYWTISEAIAVMRADDRISVETHLLDSPDGVQVLCEEVGARRLIFGSNCPLTYFLSPYLSVMNSDISESDKSLIFGGNIQRLLRSGQK